MHIIILVLIFSLSFFSETCINAEALSSLEEVSDQGTTYVLYYRDQDPKHPEKMAVSFGPKCNFRGNFLALNSCNESYVEISFETPDDFLKGEKEVELTLGHLSAMIRGSYRGSPIDIFVNGELFSHRHDPNSGKIVYDKFDITDWVQEGANTIKLQMLNGKSQYWLNSLRLNFRK